MGKVYIYTHTHTIVGKERDTYSRTVAKCMRTVIHLCAELLMAKIHGGSLQNPNSQSHPLPSHFLLLFCFSSNHSPCSHFLPFSRTASLAASPPLSACLCAPPLPSVCAHVKSNKFNNAYTYGIKATHAHTC